MRRLLELLNERPRKVLIALAASVLVIGAATPVLASHDEVSLAGSDFEVDTDANIKVDDPGPSIDWANVSEVRKADTTSGPTDESFGQGSKEDTAVPSVVDGSIPPNKSDLKFFGAYQEGSTSTGFLNLFWSRVQDPSGTTNMDFEFNQNKCVTGDAGSVCSANGVTPVRKVDDLLIIYDLSQGGTRPTLSIRKWTGSAWGPSTDLTASALATGSINTTPIPAADSDELGAQSARTFGEAQVKLSAIVPSNGGCTGFGSAYLKSRSSDSFSAALKDFVPPQAVNISNCGTVKIIKKNDAGSALSGAVFTLFNDNAPVGGNPPHGAEDTATTLKCTTASNGECTIGNVPTGSYWVVETTTPAGHDTAADQTAVVGADTTVTLTFIDPRQRGAILVTKTRKHAASGSGDHPQSGVDFTVDGVTKATDANGKACFDNLLFGSYTVHETTPAGYVGEDDKTVIVNNKAGCGDNPYGGEAVSFHNTPLSNITVSFESQITGGTASKISCTGQTADPADSTPGDFDDTSETFKNLQPGTYTCTVVVDP